ncbi:Glutathione synthetase [Cytospora paraplurivora]|uniref:Glutathione synthetase n=1 Tax=Cytospora paraplurivora TaxID=2898453 RepID=A0AAN9U0F7_9PEZI
MVIQTLTSETYPPDVDDAERKRLIEVIKDWAVANGLTVRPPPSLVAAEADPDGVLATNVPVTLFPSPFPRVCFQQAKAVQKAYNELYARVSQDEDFLSSMVKETFLWGSSVKQVEFNTIASSFGGLSSQTCSLHRFLSDTEYPYLKQPGGHAGLDLPSNHSIEGLAGGMKAAFEAYGKSDLGLETCVIFLVQGGERNVFDQRHLEYALKRSTSPRIPVFRLPYSEILQRTRISDTPKRQLLYRLPSNPDEEFEVAVIYMRSGYDPSDYPDASAWEARYHLERSGAIKCPTVLTQLAGAKKVQQVLATPKLDANSPSELSRFVPENTQAWKDLWATFTNIYPMDDSELGLEARKLALDPEQCKRYVLKPQREGGGNNCYKTSIPPFLKNLPATHWKSYILMELITPPPVSNIILRNGKLEQGGVICELGVYGTCVWDQGTGNILHNEEAGYLLRTKGDQSEEGGVAAGFGCMDSCNLV